MFHVFSDNSGFLARNISTSFGYVAQNLGCDSRYVNK